jgi:hypothetical protein
MIQLEMTGTSSGCPSLDHLSTVHDVLRSFEVFLVLFFEARLLTTLYRYHNCITECQGVASRIASAKFTERRMTAITPTPPKHTNAEGNYSTVLTL